MKPVRDPLELSPHWHVDCRIVEDLPDDNLVGTRFLINVLFGGVAVAAIIFAGWLLYLSLSLRYQIGDWERRIKDNRGEVRDIKRMQQEYAAEAVKIDQAYALINPVLNVSAFVAGLGRTRPEQMAIDVIDWNEAGITVRGSIRETPERATSLLGSYVKTLQTDEKIGPLFRRIQLTDADRGTSGDVFRFEIAFYLKSTKS